jgi:DNA-binding FrmR family transcriptional regulator
VLVAHTNRDQKKLLTRVRRIKGQAEAIEKALNQGKDCTAILQQIAAIRGAINGLMSEVLEGHLREHLGAENISQTQRQQELDDVIGILRSYLK